MPDEAETDCGAWLWGPREVEQEIAKGEPNVKVRMTGYDNCLIIEYIDENGNVCGKDKLKIVDTHGSLGTHGMLKLYGGECIGTIVRPKAAASATKPKVDEIRKWGRYFALVVDCKKATFFQFVHRTTKINDFAPDEDKPPWHPDGTKSVEPFPGQFTPGSGYKGLEDCPGPVGQTGSEAIPRTRPQSDPSKGGKPPQVPWAEGDTFTVVSEFETFICCDGELIGYFAWARSTTWKFSVGNWSAPQPGHDDTAVWHDAKKDPSPRGALITCPK